METRRSRRRKDNKRNMGRLNMSEADKMDKELEEAIKWPENNIKYYQEQIKFIEATDCNYYDEEKELYEKRIKIFKTLLKYIENSIPKEVIEKYLKEEQEHFEIYKKESKTNENLKMGMWKHLGAKNMCERILGIDRNIATSDKLLEGK